MDVVDHGGEASYDEVGGPMSVAGRIVSVAGRLVSVAGRDNLGGKILCFRRETDNFGGQ